jgi:hypothetical protein
MSPPPNRKARIERINVAMMIKHNDVDSEVRNDNNARTGVPTKTNSGAKVAVAKEIAAKGSAVKDNEVNDSAILDQRANRDAIALVDVMAVEPATEAKMEALDATIEGKALTRDEVENHNRVAGAASVTEILPRIVGPVQNGANERTRTQKIRLDEVVVIASEADAVPEVANLFTGLLKLPAQ